MESHVNIFTGRVVGSAYRALIPSRLIDALVEWRHRLQSRQELALMSQSELKDIGYPPTIMLESAKPFWIE